MRYSLLIISAFLIFSAKGQTKTYVGLKGGGHAASAFIDHTIFRNNMRTTLKSGIHTGLMVKHFPFRRKDAAVHSGIQMGINYVQKGWEQTFLTNEPNYSVRMNYLEIPLEGIGYFGNKNKYFISVGFYWEILLSTQKSVEPSVSDRGGENVDFYTYEAARDREIGYGGRTSAGIFRDFSFGSIHLEGFFTYSFSNFIDAGNLTDKTPDISNLWVAGVSVGYFIPFGKLKMTK